MCYASARVRFNNNLAKAGLADKGYTLHRLRHTFATEMLNAGMRLEVLQQLLGHTSLEVTRRYARLTDKTREEEYFNGKEDGVATEYSVEGEIIAQGDYLEGEKEGKWIYNAGDYTEEGRFVVGLREGTWKHFYANGNLKYQGDYVQGNPHKRHKIYWENGMIKEEQYYDMGIKEKTWKKYNEEGVLLMTITYKNDVEHRINGVKVDLPESEIKLIK